MIITEITQINKKKWLVRFDNDTFWPLYAGELRRYNIEPGDYEDCDYNSVYENVVLKRAKLRAMNLLKSRDRTYKQLSDKLLSDNYDKVTVSSVMDYLMSYGYIDDERYAAFYCINHVNDMSRKQVKCKLINKGVSKDIIDEALENSEIDDEQILRELIQKKRFTEKITDMASYKRAVEYLLRRGFSYEVIRKNLVKSANVYENDYEW